MRSWRTIAVCVLLCSCRCREREVASPEDAARGPAAVTAQPAPARPLSEHLYLNPDPAAEAACEPAQAKMELDFQSLDQQVLAEGTAIDRTVILDTGIQLALNRSSLGFDSALFAIAAGRKHSQLRSFFLTNFRRDRNFSGSADIVIGICGGSVRFVSIVCGAADRTLEERIAAMFMTWRFPFGRSFDLARLSLSFGAHILPPLPQTARRHLNLRISPDSLCYYLIDRAGEGRMARLREDFRKAEILETVVFEGPSARMALHSKLGNLTAADFEQTARAYASGIENLGHRSGTAAQKGAIVEAIVAVCEGSVWEVFVFNSTLGSPSREEDFANSVMSWKFPSMQLGFDFFHVSVVFGKE